MYDKNKINIYDENKINIYSENKINIYGAIGYTILKKNNHKIILFSDMHDKLKSCDNKINIDEWLKSKFKSSIILLEEIPRDGSELELIWSESEHTISLQNLYLENVNLIKGFDIRFMLIPFSWDLPKQEKICNLREYVQLLASFYKLKNEYLINKCKLYNVDKLLNTILGKHYLINKNKFIKFIKKNIHLLYNNIDSIDKNILREYDELLNDCMEWYCCALIEENSNKPIIIHTGLYHSDKITKCLKKYYNYDIIIKHGITDIENIKDDSNEGCIILSKKMDLIF
jgi:hypothetical protein